MLSKRYKNFVKATLLPVQPVLNGEQARRIYLEEVKDTRSNIKLKTNENFAIKGNKQEKELPVTNKDLFLIVQNNETEKLKCILDKYHEKINILDDYGWSLLMIACQANSIDSVKELLNRNIDISTRDKAGNSAQSLVIKNKNYVLADILVNYIEEKQPPAPAKEKHKTVKPKEYTCLVCSKTFVDKNAHLSSTLHNIAASKGKKTTANYIIPTSNRGYQLMLKGGWDRDTGLGRDGSGRKYPIKAVQKKDRKGLGHKKVECIKPSQDSIHSNKRLTKEKYNNDRDLERNFRRQFY